jgi:hypothetical protein
MSLGADSDSGSSGNAAAAIWRAPGRPRQRPCVERRRRLGRSSTAVAMAMLLLLLLLPAMVLLLLIEGVPPFVESMRAGRDQNVRRLLYITSSTSPHLSAHPSNHPSIHSSTHRIHPCIHPSIHPYTLHTTDASAFLALGPRMPSPRRRSIQPSGLGALSAAASSSSSSCHTGPPDGDSGSSSNRVRTCMYVHSVAVSARGIRPSFSS